MKIAVIVPTRNRQDLLSNLLNDLTLCRVSEDLHVIIVDSSDNAIRLSQNYPFKLTLIHTEIKSAAVQRNLGLDQLQIAGDTGINLLAFLDDDTRVPSDYFTKIEEFFELLPDAVGISGVTEILRSPSFKFLKRFFGVYGEPGGISRGGVNVPIEVKDDKTEYFQTKWLIGCSVWQYKVIRDSRFQRDFMGQSLFEDVLFSYEMSKVGGLFVIPSIRLIHIQSSIERPDIYSHHFNWVVNRYRLFELYGDEFKKRNFWFANLGKLTFELYSMIRGRNFVRFQAIHGLIDGGMKVLFK